jgi:hypothetical protein
VASPGNKPNTLVPKHVFGPFLFFQAAQLLDRPAEDGRTWRDLGINENLRLSISFRNRKTLLDFAWNRDTEAARAYLTDLLSAYLSAGRYELLPYAVVADTGSPDMRRLVSAARANDDAVIPPDSAREAVTTAVEAALRNPFPGAYRPIEVVRLHWERLAPPGDVIGTLRRRYGPIWDRTEEDEE